MIERSVGDADVGAGGSVDVSRDGVFVEGGAQFEPLGARAGGSVDVSRDGVFVEGDAAFDPLDASAGGEVSVVPGEGVTVDGGAEALGLTAEEILAEGGLAEALSRVFSFNVGRKLRAAA